MSNFLGGNRTPKFRSVSHIEFRKGDSKFHLKYQFDGSLKVAGKMRFVRVLRNHIMVRVGGRWDEIENFLSRHKPDRIGKIKEIDWYVFRRTASIYMTD